MKWKAIKKFYDDCDGLDGYNVFKYPDESCEEGSEIELLFIKNNSIPRLIKMYNIFITKFEDYQNQNLVNRKIRKRIIDLEKKVLRYSDILVAIDECTGDKNGR